MNRPPLVIGPYVGELGWEIISWQPLARRLWLDNRPSRTVVFTGPGRRTFYRYADEVRTLPDLPKHEAECHGWHDMNRHIGDFKAADWSVQKFAQDMFPDGAKVFTPFNLEKLNDPMHKKGSPELLRGDDGLAGKLVGDLKDFVLLCVRDRTMSDFRNWPYECWGQLAGSMFGVCPVVIVGNIQDKVRWASAIDLNGAVDLTDRTTLDDCLALICRARLVAGGTTGLLHLASRAGIDHLIWGAGHGEFRYHESNWFGAHFKYLSADGWKTPWESVSGEAKHYLGKGVFS